MTAAFNDVDLEMGHVSGKSFEGALTDDYGFGDDDYYGEDVSSPTQGVPGQIYGDCTNHEKNDDAIFKSGKGQIESVLLFIGLLSAAVILFIIESYKKSPPDPGEQTIALLNQLSQQLMMVSKGTPFDLPPSPGSIPFRSSPPAVRASTLWLMSLGLNIACAIWAVLRLQRSTDLPGQCGKPQKHARVRAYHFLSIGRLDMEPTVEVIWVLLHASVFLFFIGLIDFLLLINKTVACIVLCYSAPLLLAYIATTLLMRFFPNSRFFTPSSSGSTGKYRN